MRCRSHAVRPRRRSCARSSTAPITDALMVDAVVIRRPGCSSYQQPVRVSCTDAVTRWRGKSRASEATKDGVNGVAQLARAAVAREPTEAGATEAGASEAPASEAPASEALA